MTEVIYTDKWKINKSDEQIFSNNYHYVEMRPKKTLPIYQFKLRQQPNFNGVYVLIRDNSEILKYLKSGQKVDILYHPKKDDSPVEKFKTQIINIVKREHGRLKGHFKVTLSIVD